MKSLKLLVLILLAQALCLSCYARPGESVDKVVERYNLNSSQSIQQGDYVSYKITDTKFVSQPTIFLKLGAKGIVLEQNFLFDKNTVHEKDVQKSKSDTRPTVSIPHHAYLIGDFSQLPREQFNTTSRAVGVVAAPFGAAVGTIAGAGRGIVEGTKIGVSTASSASKALGGDISGKAAAWASSATAVTTGAVTGLFAGLTGGAVEGSVRGARVALEGISGADREITGATSAVSDYIIIGGRIGKELSPDEQKVLLDELGKLEASRLADASGKSGSEDLADSKQDSGESGEYVKSLDSAKDRSGFETDINYLSEDAANKNVAGMW